jgi:hypothetical protein
MSSLSLCPDSRALQAFAAGSLDDRAAALIRAHLDTCAGCRATARRLQDAARTPLDPGPPGGPVTAPEEATLDVSTEREDGDDPDLPGPPGQDEPTDVSAELSFLLPSPDPQALGRVGHYDVRGVLGRGGMGVVLKAFDPALHRTVAIKVLSAQLATSGKAHRRFLREARAAAAINHPNVVTIHAVEEQGGMPYLVMEYVAGRSLRQRLRVPPPLDLLTLLRIGSQVAAGLAAAHQQGVIHRDVKPANIMLEDHVERVKLTDFGLARVAMDSAQLTSAERLVGTPAYMSPEQVLGRTVDARSDLFGLGCVLHAMVTGHSPFQGSHPVEVARKVADLVPEPLHRLNPIVPRPLSDVVARLLEKRPEDRYQSAAEVARLLHEQLAAATQAASSGVQPAAPPRPPRRRWLRPAVAVALLLLVATGAGVALFRLGMPRPGAEPGPAPTSAPAAEAPVLTVARDGAADFRTLGEALHHAGPGATVRILDGATYPESLTIDNAARWRGLTLEAPGHAALEPPAGAAAGVVIDNTPGITLRGLRIQVPRINQHGILIRGDAAGVTVEQVVSTQPPGSVWANLYVCCQARGSAAAPIRVRDCIFVSGDLGAVLEGNTGEVVSDLELERNRFTCTGTHVLLNRAVRDVSLRNNLFIEGYLGLTVSLTEPGLTQRVRLANNTWLRTRRWLGLVRADLATDVEFANNLLLGVEGTDLPGAGEGLPSWTFRANYWEASPRTDRQAAARLATLWDDAGLLSRDPADANFLRPGAGSPAATAGEGGDRPSYVGAVPPKVGKD